MNAQLLRKSISKKQVYAQITWRNLFLLTSCDFQGNSKANSDYFS